MKGFVLTGLDGSNPLAFLAALGVLRLASLRWPDDGITLSWERRGRWTPELHGAPVLSDTDLCAELHGSPAAPAGDLVRLGKNITVSQETFAEFMLATDARTEHADRRLADFAAAFGSEVCADDRNGRIQNTLFCFITGSGHQDFLGTIHALLGSVTSEHVHAALFAAWRDADKGLSFRWNPSDARSYALRWNDPGPEGAWTTWGANRLAFEALPLFPAMPGATALQTTGFVRPKGGWPEFTWPVWTATLCLDEIRSLIALPCLHETEPDVRMLRSIGIEQAFRAARVRIGQGANFKVSFRPSRGI